MRCLHSNNSYTIRQRVHLQTAKRWSINHKSVKPSQFFSSSFEISEMKWRNVISFPQVIYYIYYVQLSTSMWESNVTWNWRVNLNWFQIHSLGFSRYRFYSILKLDNSSINQILDSLANSMKNNSVWSTAVLI